MEFIKLSKILWHCVCLVILQNGVELVFNQLSGADLVNDFEIKFATKCFSTNIHIRKFLYISVQDCIEECDARHFCGGVVYYRRVSLFNLLPQMFQEDDADYARESCIVAKKRLNSLSNTTGQFPTKCNCSGWLACDTGACIPKECPPLKTDNGTILGNSHYIGSRVRIKCHYGYIEDTGTRYADCLPDGSWSYKPRCVKFLACSPWSSDGEYWINPTVLNGSKVKVYCHGLNTDNPNSYLTVNPTTNAIEKAVIANFTFRKVQVNLQNSNGNLLFWISVCAEEYLKITIGLHNLYDVVMTSQITRITVGVVIRNPKTTLTMIINQYDLTFADANNITAALNTNWGRAYGVGLGCRSGVFGYFSIDTSGTGFIVDPKIEWTISGKMAVMQGYARSADNRTISAFCGGLCGICSPNAPLLLLPDETQDIADEAAMFPECPQN